MKKWKPTKTDIEWLANLIRVMRDGGEWGVPDSSSVIKFDKQRKVAVLLIGSPLHEVNRRTTEILKLLGWTMEVQTKEVMN